MKEINKYHFFAWDISEGWQHLGYTDGYETIEECKKHNAYYINRDNWKIMELRDIGAKK